MVIPKYAVDGMDNAHAAIRSDERFAEFWLVFAAINGAAAGAAVAMLAYTREWHLIIVVACFVVLTVTAAIRRKMTLLVKKTHEDWLATWQDYR